MTILDSLSLAAMTVVLAVLLHVGGIVNLNPAPIVHALAPAPEALQQSVELADRAEPMSVVDRLAQRH